MAFMSFLGNVQAVPQEQAKKTVANTNKKERNPVTADIRVFKTGAVYPSAVAVQKYGLDYAEKNSILPGFGFDVIDSRQWPALKTDNPAIFISPVRRDLGKVDLFSQCSYESNGQPKTTVMEQGATTFGKQLLQMIAEVYGVAPTEEQDYVDMTIVEDADLQNFMNDQFNRIFLFPKTIARGEDKGKPSYVRRENALVYGFIPTSLLNNEASSTEGENAAELTTEADLVTEEQA